MNMMPAIAMLGETSRPWNMPVARYGSGRRLKLAP